MFKNLSKEICLVSFAFFLFFISIFLVSGLTWTTDYITVNVNSSDYWDNLDTPLNITGNEFWINHTIEVFNLWNATWDESHLVGYNHSLNVLTRWGADFNSTFNQTYSNWNETYANTLYPRFNNMTNQTTNRSDFWDALDVPTDITNSEYWYNHTIAVYDLWNGKWGFNHSTNVFNLWGASWNETRNPFDQDLNTTSSPNFTSLNISERSYFNNMTSTKKGSVWDFYDLEGALFHVGRDDWATGQEEGFWIRPDVNQDAGDVICGCQSGAGADRFEVEHSGATSTANRKWIIASVGAEALTFESASGSSFISVNRPFRVNSDATSGVSAIYVSQLDADKGFFNFDGITGNYMSANIFSDTSVGTAGTLLVKVEGTEQTLMYYDLPPIDASSEREAGGNADIIIDTDNIIVHKHMIGGFLYDYAVTIPILYTNMDLEGRKRLGFSITKTTKHLNFSRDSKTNKIIVNETYYITQNLTGSELANFQENYIIRYKAYEWDNITKQDILAKANARIEYKMSFLKQLEVININWNDLK